MRRKTINLIIDVVHTAIVLFCCIIVVLLVVGCAALPLTRDECNVVYSPTAHEHEQCLRAASEYEDEEYERENRRILRHQDVVARLNACVAGGGLVIEVIHGRRMISQRKKSNEPYTLDNVSASAFSTDFRCILSVGRPY